MVNQIEEFKLEKLKNYHKNLSIMSKIQLNNTKLYSDLWNNVSENKNVKKYEI